MAHRTYLFAVLYLCITGNSVAQEPPAELGEIRVTAPVEVRGAPSAFSTIIEPEAEGARFTTASELLSQSVGTHVRSLGGLGQFSTVSIRGSSAEQVAVYLDGIRINSGETGVVDMATVPVNGVERIEVIRGGGTAQFGNEAIGGVINIVTKRANPGHTIEASGTTGSFFTFKGNANYRAQREHHRLVVSATHLQSRGDYSFVQATTTLAGTPVSGGGKFSRNHNRVVADNLLTKLDVDTDPDTHINCTNAFFFTDRQLPGTETEALLLAPANPLEATQRIFRNLTHVGVELEDVWTPRLGLAFGFHNSFEHARFDDPSPVLGPGIRRTAINDAINPYFRWTYTAPTPRGGHEMTLRYGFRRDIHADETGNATTSTIGLKERDTHHVALQNDWRMGNERVLLLPVVQYHHANDFGSTLSGKLGLAVRPIAPLTLKANVEQAYRFPTFVELYYPDEGYLRGNPNLAKESSLNWDAGALGTWTNGKVEVAYFQHHIRNSILFVPISATTIQPINTFTARADGIEVSAEATPSSFLYVAGNYTWLRSHFTSTGLQLPGRPRHTGNVRLELFRDFTSRWGGKIFADGQWISRLPVNVANSVFLAARTTLDLGLTATLTTRATTKYFATIEAKDITNVQIYDARGFPLPRRSFFFTIGAKWS